MIKANNTGGVPNRGWRSKGRKRRCAYLFVASWTMWFLVSAVTGGAGLVADLAGRARLAWASLVDLMRAIGAAIYHVVNFVAPFAIAVGSLASSALSRVGWRARLIGALVGFTLIGIHANAKQYLERKQDIYRFGFHVSFLAAGPALWFALGWLPNSAQHALLRVLTSVAPCIFSLRAYAARDIARCGSWLAYWVVFPTVESTRYAVSTYGIDTDSDDVTRTLVVFTVWLQAWGGSLTFYMACSAAARSAAGLIPLDARATLACLPRIGFMRVRRSASWLTQNLARMLAAAVFATAAVLMLSYGLLRSLAPIAFMWGASLDAAEVVRNRIEQLYAQKLAFWILVQACNEVMEQVPILGGAVGLFSLPIIICSFLFGHAMLSFIIDRSPLAQSAVGGSPAAHSKNRGVALGLREAAKAKASPAVTPVKPARATKRAALSSVGLVGRGAGGVGLRSWAAMPTGESADDLQV